MRRSLLLVLAIAAVGCGADDGGGGYDYAASPAAARFADHCEVCHGEAGDGGLAPRLRDTDLSLATLTSTIAERMPPSDPGSCTGACASELAAFIRDGLRSSALACDVIPPGPRQLRLLTRREYRATVADLLGAAAPAMTCARATDCAFRDACAAGRCEPSACDAHTFVFDPGGRTYATVHVAGSWNGWPGTAAGGGWPLTYAPATGQWTGTFTLGAGEHTYKFVLDERDWVEDPRAPTSVPDGFGGRNSVVALACAGGASDPVAAVPIESRPTGFLFDTNAAAQAVTAGHVEAYLAAAGQLADDAVARKAALYPCDWAGDRAGCARAWLAAFGRRAFRRPLTTPELDRYGALADADDDAGLATALHALLISPHFLYRSELGEAQGDGSFRLTGYERATALAYALVGSTPDDALLAAAERGELDDVAGLEREARRLLDDPRARTQVGEFALQWLGAEAVATADKRPDLFPDFDPPTRAALAHETRAFAAHVVFDGGHTLGELLTADYTILDPVAARFYGVAAPTDPTGKVAYTDGRRAGVLGHASVLASHAHSDQTSPIRRGLFVRRNLLCQALPPPPAFAGGVPEVDPGATTRERFAQHTANPVCAGCHRFIDGLGFGFEQFDPVGRWRTLDAGHPIDATGELRDVERLGSGTSMPYATVPELATLVAASDAATTCFTRQYVRFTRGVRTGLADRCARIAMSERLAAAGGDVRELMIATIVSPDFGVRR
ncbi:MAG: DUF1592 domain-containing protein [Myxococcales bacterium]|nr:DUF1592 domain-containing protein [Myxococcales bacterium]